MTGARTPVRPRPILAVQHTEGAWPLRLYRRLLPRGIRALVARRISPENRNRIIFRLVSSDPLWLLHTRVVRMWLLVARPSVIGAQGRVLVRDGRRARVAETASDLSPVQARRDTMDFVRTALSSADVPFFLVRGSRNLSSVIGVAAANRASALAALRSASRDSAAYVCPVPGRGALRPRPGSVAGSWRRLTDAPVIRVIRYFAPPGGQLILGAVHGCDLEFWAEKDDRLVAPRPNQVTATLPRHDVTVEAPEQLFSELTEFAASGGRTYPTRREFTVSLIEDIRFPIDAVYTWVDGDDPAWQARHERALNANGATVLNRQAIGSSRFTSRDELRYSLRSLAMYAPWVRHIWIVTDAQVPPWLNTAHPKITVVDHKEIFGDRGRLPTFNSHAIETQLHHIDGLAEQFLYLNDDVFFGRPVSPRLFFRSNGLSHFFTSKVQIDLGQAQPDDPPVLAAGKNNRKIIAEAFGRTVTQKMKHAPHPLRRSVLAEMEIRFAEHMAETARHQFRNLDDLSVPSSLHHYYGYLNGRSMPGVIRYLYTDLADRETAYRLRRLLSARSYDVFCLNDTDADDAAQIRQRDHLLWFLEAYFPLPGPYEKN